MIKGFFFQLQQSIINCRKLFQFFNIFSLISYGREIVLEEERVKYNRKMRNNIKKVENRIKIYCSTTVKGKKNN
jgi:hypothetical protein